MCASTGNYSVILLDESIRERPQVEQFYVVSAVQPRFESKDGRDKTLEALRSGLIPLAEGLFGRPYWIRLRRGRLMARRPQRKCAGSSPPHAMYV